MQTKKIIKQLLTKELKVTNIYKRIVNNFYSIEFVCVEKNTYITLYYKTEKLLDEAFLTMDREAFWSLSFNPIKTAIPPPPYVAPPPLPPLYTPPYPCHIGGMMIHAKIFWEFFWFSYMGTPIFKNFFPEIFG